MTWAAPLFTNNLYLAGPANPFQNEDPKYDQNIFFLIHLLPKDGISLMWPKTYFTNNNCQSIWTHPNDYITK